VSGSSFFRARAHLPHPPTRVAEPVHDLKISDPARLRERAPLFLRRVRGLEVLGCCQPCRHCRNRGPWSAHTRVLVFCSRGCRTKSNPQIQSAQNPINSNQIEGANVPGRLLRHAAVGVGRGARTLLAATMAAAGERPVLSAPDSTRTGPTTLEAPAVSTTARGAPPAAAAQQQLAGASRCASHAAGESLCTSGQLAASALRSSPVENVDHVLNGTRKLRKGASVSERAATRVVPQRYPASALARTATRRIRSRRAFARAPREHRVKQIRRNERRQALFRVLLGHGSRGWRADPSAAQCTT
jgi:hypothetical protein